MSADYHRAKLDKIQAEAENAALRADAERWRIARGTWNEDIYDAMISLTGDELDAAIDAARRGE